MPDYSKVPNYIPTPADKLTVKDPKKVAELLSPGAKVCFVDVEDILGGIGRDRLEELCEQRQLVVKNRVTKAGIDVLISGDTEVSNGKLSEAVNLKIPLIRQLDFESWFRNRPMTTGAASDEVPDAKAPELNEILGYNAIVTVVGTINIGGKEFSTEEDLRFLGDALDLVFRKELILGKTNAIIAAEGALPESIRDTASFHNIPVYNDEYFSAWVNEQLMHTTPHRMNDGEAELTKANQSGKDDENKPAEAEDARPLEQLEESSHPYPAQSFLYGQTPMVPHRSKPDRMLIAATISGLITVITYFIYFFGFFASSQTVALIFGGANMLLQVVTFGLCVNALGHVWQPRPPKVTEDYKLK